MAFHEVQFPPQLSYGATGGPGFNTSIIETRSGQEQRNGNWSIARAKYDVATSIKTESDMLTVNAFFRARLGRLHGFRFKDWSDYKLSSQSIGTGDSSETTFQIIKVYTDTVNPYTRTISKPVAGTTRIFLDSIEQLSGWTVNTTTGVVTFSSAPGSGVDISVEGEFDIPCRFDTDQFSPEISAYDQLVWTGIPIIELRV